MLTFRKVSELHNAVLAETETTRVDDGNLNKVKVPHVIREGAQIVATVNMTDAEVFDFLKKLVDDKSS